MKIIVTGCTGRIGKELLKACIPSEQHIKLIGGVLRVGNNTSGIDLGELIGRQSIGTEATDNIESIIDGCDGVIDFTSPEATLQYAKICCEHNKFLVSGTTGFSNQQYSNLEIFGARGKIFHSPNMSIAVNWVARLAKMTAAMFDEDFDIEILEMHHRNKKDSPSGTALMYGKACAEGREIDFDENSILSREGVIGERPKGKIGFAALRGGATVGEHTVIFAGQDEHIEITHKSYNKAIYAQGALNIASWMLNKKTKGLVSIKEYLSDMTRV